MNITYLLVLMQRIGKMHEQKLKELCRQYDLSLIEDNCINHFIFIHIITNFRRKRNDGNVMGTADYVRQENLFTGTETFKGQGKRGPD